MKDQYMHNLKLSCIVLFEILEYDERSQSEIRLLIK